MSEVSYNFAALAERLYTGRAPSRWQGRAIEVEERLAQVLELRLDAADADLRHRIEQCLGTVLPVLPNTVVDESEMLVASFSPNRWLVLRDGAAQGSLLERLTSAAGNSHATVVDLSDGYAMMVVSGERAFDLIAQGCPLDLSTVDVGQCARSLLGRAAVMIVPLTCQPKIAIVFEASLAPYLWFWLLDAVREFEV